VGVHRAYERMNAGDDLLAAGDTQGAMKPTATPPACCRTIRRSLLGGDHDDHVGQEKDGLVYLKDVFAADPNWVEVTRGSRRGLLPDDRR